ncbi:hypothetical protein F4860DRAFT_503769 [Xylaria cubensis]|nr:hypothetical protein F4860DRAFT_503769 [Xylaria cubensis]
MSAVLIVKGSTCASLSTHEVQEPWTSRYISSQATIVDFVELYFEISNPIFLLFHRPSFVKRVLRGEYMSDKPLFISIMAICLDADVFYTETRRQLSSAGDQIDLHIIRSHALLAIAAIQNGRIRDLHRYLGIYHMLKWPVGIGLIEREERRRLFWSIYTLDVFQNVIWCGTIRSREQQANVSYPVEVEDEFLFDDGISLLVPSLTNASLSMNKASPSFSNSSRNQRDCWLFGWNFITDFGFLIDIFQDQNTVTAISVSDSAVQMYVNLPESFKQTPQMTYDSRKDLFGLKAANITASLYLLRIVLFTADGASIQDRCRVASEGISAFISILVGYLVAIGTPLLHHLGGIGTILGTVLEEPLREDEYRRLSKKLRTQDDLQQDILQSNLFPSSSCHGSVHNGQMNHGMNKNWSFTIPSDLLS